MEKEIIKQYIIDNYLLGNRTLQDCMEIFGLTRSKTNMIMDELTRELLVLKKFPEKLPHENWLYDLRMGEVLGKCSEETLKHLESIKN